ncbi:MAG: regulatory protein RecX [bacterium]
MFDGAAPVTLAVDAIERLGLRVGRSIAGLEARLAEEAAELAVFDRALNMLAFRARASTELSRALVRKGADAAAVAKAVTRLQQQGFLDDRAFAEAFARLKVVGASHSRRRVQLDLARKGVARDVADAAIAAVFDTEGIEQGSIVEAAARKKLRTLARHEPMVRRRRLYAFLARRGYDGDDIRRTMDAMRVELGADFQADE